jgi:hypothetical protein
MNIVDCGMFQEYNQLGMNPCYSYVCSFDYEGKCYDFPSPQPFWNTNWILSIGGEYMVSFSNGTSDEFWQSRTRIKNMTLVRTMERIYSFTPTSECTPLAPVYSPHDKCIYSIVCNQDEQYALYIYQREVPSLTTQCRVHLDMNELPPYLRELD